MFKVTLPEEEGGDDEKRNDDQDRNPRSSPANDVTLGQGEHESKQADGNERGTNPVNSSCLGPKVLVSWSNGGRGRRDTEYASNGDHAGHDSESSKDPFPTGPFCDETGNEVTKDAAERCTGCVCTESVVLGFPWRKRLPENP